MKKSKIINVIIAALLGIFGLSLVPNTTYAVNVCEQPNVSEEVRRANGCPGLSDQTKLSDVIIGIVNGIVGVLAIVAVIFIVVGGFNYMTSAGDTGKVQKAKNTIIYALIGLVIAVLAFAIVNFVISNIINNAENSEQTTDGGGNQTSGGGGNQTNGGGNQTNGGGGVIQGGGGNK